jgi:RNA polymerase sigma-70 factor (ECF subfamily)
VPASPPVDVLVRIEQDDPQHDGERDDGHAANVPGGEPAGLVSGTVLSHPAPESAAVNSPAATRIEEGVSAAADILPFFGAPPAPPAPAPTLASAAPAPHRAAASTVAGTTAAHTSQGRSMSDEDGLVRRAAAGDAEAFRGLFVRHRSDVARLVYRMLNGPSDLEDVVQEVFVQVFRSLKDFRGQSKFSTWLHRVTVNVVLMHRRSARSRPVLTEEVPNELVADDRQTLPDEDAERHERMRAFQRLLARLADKKRIVFVLHELEGMSPAEISEVVGAPVLTVRTRLFYARRELEEMLAEEPALAGLAALMTKGDAK